MSQLYNKAVEVVIGKQGETGLSITDLRVSFDITKRVTSEPNHGKISIYNLNKLNRDAISGSDIVCVLKAGYNSDASDPIMGIIFGGDVFEVDSKKSGGEIITEITVLERQVKNTSNHVEVNFSSAIKTEKVIRTILKHFGYREQAVTNIIKEAKDKGYSLSKEWPNGLSLSGNVKTVLDRVLSYEGLNWFVIDDLIFIDKINAKKTDEAILLTSETGLLDVPFSYYSKKHKKKEDITTEGLKIKCLMQPDLKPGKIIKIVSEGVNGFFKILEARFTGDTHGGEWVVEVLAQ